MTAGRTFFPTHRIRETFLDLQQIERTNMRRRQVHGAPPFSHAWRLARESDPQDTEQIRFGYIVGTAIDTSLPQLSVYSRVRRGKQVASDGNCGELGKKMATEKCQEKMPAHKRCVGLAIKKKRYVWPGRSC